MSRLWLQNGRLIRPAANGRVCKGEECPCGRTDCRCQMWYVAFVCWDGQYITEGGGGDCYLPGSALKLNDLVWDTPYIAHCPDGNSAWPDEEICNDFGVEEEEGDSFGPWLDGGSGNGESCCAYRDPPAIFQVQTCLYTSAPGCHPCNGTWGYCSSFRPSAAQVWARIADEEGKPLIEE